MDRSRRTIRSVEEQFHALFAADVAGAILTHMHELDPTELVPIGLYRNSILTAEENRL